MSLSTSLNNAFSGLSANSRHAEVVSNNVSNAMIEGYNNKNIELSSITHGGVRIEGITRAEDPVATAGRRLTDAKLASASTSFEALERIETAFGAPGSASALASRAAEFEADLRSHANAPHSIPDARAVLSSMENYAEKIRSIAGELSDIRELADANINDNVKSLNSALQGIEELNTLIAQIGASGKDATGIQDQRAMLVDQIATIVPVRSYKRPDGMIALFTPTGGTLIDGRAREFGFDASPHIAPSMTFAGGALSGLTVDGEPVDVNSGLGFFDGGSLAANFEIRDTTIPNTDARLDGLARDLIERFQDPAVDPTLGAGDAGLFTDSGLAFTAINELGLASRISVNSAIDPDQGGRLTNLRDGINALTNGDSGDNTVLRNVLDALVTPIAPSASLQLTSNLNAPDLSAALTADITQQSQKSEHQFAYLTGEQALLRSSELDRISVDTDDQMQKLIAIEQAYAANARVITVVDELMQTLLNI